MILSQPRLTVFLRNTETKISFTVMAYPIGERFFCNEYVYEVTELIDGYIYKMKCETEGTEANTNFGSLSPVDYIDAWQGGEITEVIIAGHDDQDEEEFRQEIIKSFKNSRFGGNKADYRKFINDIDGVGGCKPKRREVDSPWVNVWIISDTYDVPSTELVNGVQSAVDPEENHGEGDGLAPICHVVKIHPVDGVEISVSAAITFDTGFSASTSLEAIKTTIDGYFKGLREEWSGNDLGGMIVRLAQVEAKIISVEGVLDVTETTLNGSAGNITLDFTQIPVLGGVTVV